MIKSTAFVLRLAIAWFLLLLLATGLYTDIPALGRWELPIVVFDLAVAAFVLAGTLSHLRRVRLVAGHIDRGALGNRHRRQIEIPFEAGQAFDLLDAAIRELPGIERVDSARDSLQIRARLRRPVTYGTPAIERWNPLSGFGRQYNQVLATVTPTHDSGSATVICEPQIGAWSDWFLVDDGTNLENAEAISRAVTRRVADRRRGEQDAVARTETEKELTVARLNLLHAQVEPHFLYNTLASAQLLTRSDPERAEVMLGHLIQYLRHSLPSTDDARSTLGAELERALAYLEIMKVRMGARLAVQVDVPEALRGVSMPPMMLQTLVENAVKHGLEPRTAGGTVWIRARRADGQVTVTVADDGDGFGGATGGTGIGLANIRERLRLAYDGAASVAVVANFPAGVAATLTLPDATEVAHG